MKLRKVLTNLIFLSFDPTPGIQCCKFCQMSNRKPPTRELSTGDFYKGRAEIFFMFSPFSLCGQKPGARITVFYTASLRRRRTGWSRGPASCSWRRSRSWRRRWTGTWTGSAKQVRRVEPGQQLPFSSFEIENRFPDFFWPESEDHVGQILMHSLQSLASRRDNDDALSPSLSISATLSLSSPS